ncbi:transposase family protein [Streptomyces sp. NPDC004237]|uniref:transposase family protein n=1 Tax=Streptomyces sp. NPDC004237 TaxID=3154455 RepID=UPI0033A40C55
MTCPDCGTPARRVHSRSRRRLADAGFGGRPAVIDLCVRRLFCDTERCVRRTSSSPNGAGVRPRRKPPAPVSQHAQRPSRLGICAGRTEPVKLHRRLSAWPLTSRVLI